MQHQPTQCVIFTIAKKAGKSSSGSNITHKQIKLFIFETDQFVTKSGVAQGIARMWFFYEFRLYLDK